MRRTARALLVAALAIGVLIPIPSRGQGSDPQYLEAKRLFDALDYESAIRALDQAIGGLLARPLPDPVRRSLLPSAYEMRARSKFGLGDQEGARADFVALLRVNPGYVITGQISPRVITLFEDAVKETVTTVTLSITPANAKIALDETPITAAGPMPIVVGDHVISVDRPGYRRVQQPLVAEANKPTELSIVLERISSLVQILTVPADVEVTIDGVKRGRMAAGPPAPEFADVVARAGVPPGQVSAAMVITDLPPGEHVVELRRDCYVRAEKRLAIDKPDDYTIGPVVLEKAVAMLTVRANEPGTQLFIDGQARATTSAADTELCEGEHAVEVRSASGRYFKRVQARPGERIVVEAVVKPALALVSVAGQPAAGGDLRITVERVFDALRSTTLFAPPADQAEQALKTNQLPAAWLAFDGNRRPVDPSTDVAQPVRRDVSARLAGVFGAQGIASVTVVGRNRVVLSLLAAGSGQPDVVAVSLDSPESIAAAIAQIDRAPSFFRPSIGLAAIDVADVAGAVVASVDAGGPAGTAGIRAGSVVTKANGQPITDATALAALLAGRKQDDDLVLEVKDRMGAVKNVTVKVLMTPRLIGVSDQTLLANRMLLVLRARLVGQNSPAEETILRLNLAAALAHVEAWADARSELQRVVLPDGPGIAKGTVQYLLGLVAEKLGSRAEAEAALKLAAASESLLTENGPPVKELAEAKLAELSRPGR
jgi:hypothetical protein